DHKKPVWWVNEIYFTPVKRPRVASGCLNFSPGWLAQGHHVSIFLVTNHCSNKDSTLEWLEQIDKLQILSNILIKLLHPELYEAGLTALSGLRHESQTIDRATRWNSIFTCLCVISSRISKQHRDSNGDNKFFDILFNLG
ncbi:hypothetical protein C8R41DRAFT_746488, partial [Lentinula lateritia]